jgi:tryptophanyl-tRNA synthetase
MEFARDIAGNFNKTYKINLFKLPEAYIEENVQTIP